MRGAWVAVSMLCAGLVLADEAGPYRVEEVMVSGRQLNLIGEAVSASEGRLGPQDIEIRPLLRTGEVLELVPGMVVTQHSGSGKANQYFLRGTNLDHGTDFSTVVDGMPVNMRSHGHGQGYTDINFLIPELVSSMSYRKGPYYADAGDFSGVGSVKIHTGQVLERNRLSLTAGEYGYQRLLAMGDTTLGDNNLLLALERNTYEGPWRDIDEDIDKTNIVLALTQPLMDGVLTTRLMAYENSWNSADQIPRRAVRDGIVDTYGSLDTGVGGESSRYSLSSEWRGEHGGANLYLIDYELKLFSNFTYFLVDPANGDQFEQYDDRTIYGGDVYFEFGSAAGAGPLSSRVGLEWRYDDVGKVGLYRTADRQRLATVRQDRLDELSLGLFWQSSLAFGERVSLTGALRYDYYDFDVDSNLAANSGKTDDGIFSAKMSLSYQLSESLEGYLGIGQSFHSNDARGATISIDPVTLTAVDSVDPLVRVEGGEIGLRYFSGGRINASLAFWTLEADSELLFVGDAGTTEASRASERRGVEATLYYQVSEHWLVDMEYAYTRARFSESALGEGDYIDGALPEVLSAGIAYVADRAWYGSLRYRYFGERSLDSFNDVKSDATQLLNGKLGYRWERLDLSLDVLNLLDSDDHDIDYFYASRLAGEAASGVEDIHFHPVEPRAVRANLTLYF